MSGIYLDFAGWAMLKPETKMTYIGEDAAMPETITVSEYVNLPQEEKKNYILEDFIAALRNAEETDFLDLEIYNVVW